MNINSYVRAMGSWDLFRSAFQIYRRYFWSLILIHSINIIGKVLTDGINLLVLPSGILGSLAFLWLGSLFFQPLIVIFTTAATIILVSNAVVGREVSISHAFRRVLSHQLFGRLLIGSLIIGVLSFALTFILLVTAGLGGWFVAPLFIAAIFMLLVWTAFFAPSVVLEKNGMKQGFRRGFRLALGSFWRILWQYVLVFYLPYLVFSNITFFTVSAAVSNDVGIGVTIVLLCALFPVLILAVLGTPVGSLILLLLYYDARARKENYNVDNLADDLGFQPIGEAALI